MLIFRLHFLFLVTKIGLHDTVFSYCSVLQLFIPQCSVFCERQELLLVWTSAFLTLKIIHMHVCKTLKERKITKSMKISSSKNPAAAP